MPHAPAPHPHDEDPAEPRRDAAGEHSPTPAHAPAADESAATSVGRARPRVRWSLVVMGAALAAVVIAALWGLPRNSTTGDISSSAVLLDAWEEAAASPERGAAPLGSRAPEPPADAVYVDAGAEGGDGSQRRPYGSLTEALENTGSGATIVLREGVYHETAYVIDRPEAPHANVTIQAHPGEEVWLDGTRELAWTTREGRAVAEFEDFASWNDWGSYGDYDETGDLAFVGEQNPVAADPTEVWLDGERLTQVPADPGPGEFAVERGERRDARSERGALLLLGAEPAGGSELRIAARNQALVGNAPGLTLDGFGVRGYATPVNWMGTVYLEGDAPTVRDLVLEDLPSNALSLSGATGALVEHVTVTDPGLEGIGAVHSDDATFRALHVSGANHNRFNAAPVSAGMKFVQMRGFTVTDSTIERTHEATGLWIDESATDFTVADNLVTRSGRNGMQIEISGRASITGNTVLRSEESGMLLYGAQDLDVRENLIAGSGGHGDVSASITVLQDQRRAADGGMGVDTRVGSNGLTWISGGLTLADNVLALPAPRASAQVAVVDLTSQLSADDMGVTVADTVLVDNPTRLGSRGAVPALLWRAGTDESLGTDADAAARLGERWTGNTEVGWGVDQRIEEEPAALESHILEAVSGNGTSMPPAIKAAEVE